MTAMLIAVLVVMLLNLVHWAFTRRAGFLPSPSGVPGLVLQGWFWAAALMSLLALMQLLPVELTTSTLLAWGIARHLGAVWVRQVRMHGESTLELE